MNSSSCAPHMLYFVITVRVHLLFDPNRFQEKLLGNTYRTSPTNPPPHPGKTTPLFLNAFVQGSSRIMSSPQPFNDSRLVQIEGNIIIASGNIRFLIEVWDTMPWWRLTYNSAHSSNTLRKHVVRKTYGDLSLSLSRLGEGEAGKVDWPSALLSPN